MTYPIEKEVEINEEIIKLTIYSGLTILIGPNGSGKTRVLKQLKKCKIGRASRRERVWLKVYISVVDV